MKKPDTHELTIGSDPELAIVDTNGERIDAYRIINDDSRRELFGLDGCSNIAELRPRPASDPIEHAENIKHIFYNSANRDNFKQVYKYRLLGAYTRSPMGGHIHIGHPYIAREAAQSFRTSPRRQELIRALIGTFDSLVSFPLMYLEDPEAAAARKIRGSYGKLGDFREDHEYGIEYRTPASWLASEKLAKGVLCTAYAVAWDVLKNDYSYTELRDKSGFAQAYNGENRELLKPYLPDALKEIKKTELYPFYQSHIDYILHMSARNMNLYSTDIRIGWHIPYAKVRKAVLLSIQTLTAHISEHMERGANVDNTPIRYNFILSRMADWNIPQIRDNVNAGINQALSNHYDPDQSGQYNPVYIFGRNKEYGDILTIEYNSSVIPTRRITRLIRIINDVLIAFKYPGTIQIQANARRNGSRFEANTVMKIGIGRPLREFATFAPEAIIYLCILYANNAIYKSYRVHKKTGRNVTLPIIAKSILPAMKKIIEHKKTLPLTPEQLQEETQRAMREQEERNRAYERRTRTSRII